jgi:type II secretory pathway predicted ATPase ExeA
VVCNCEIESNNAILLGCWEPLSDCRSPNLRNYIRERSRVLRADDVRRARLILMLAEGQSWSTIQHALGCSSAYIARWQTLTLLIGEAGTGKTTLINVLLNQHFQCVANGDGHAIYNSKTGDLVRIAYLTNSKLGFEEMLGVVLDQLGYPSGSTTKPELIRKFERLFRQLRPKERIVIIVDEAQALSDQALEEIRLFSNYGEYGKGHLEILLVGQPELLTRLMEPSLRQFHQRIGARAILNPLQREEAFEYIEHKLRESGGSTKKIFRKRALEILVDHSHGIPRQLNLLCNNALIRAYGSDLRFVTVKFAREAIREYENLAGTGEEFREPVGRRALHSIASHSAIPIAGVASLH